MITPIHLRREVWCEMGDQFYQYEDVMISISKEKFEERLKNNFDNFMKQLRGEQQCMKKN